MPTNGSGKAPVGEMNQRMSNVFFLPDSHVETMRVENFFNFLVFMSSLVILELGILLTEVFSKLES